MINRRQAMRRVFSGDAPEGCPPICLRMDLWHSDAAWRGTLPPDMIGASIGEIEDRLGFCRSVRYRTRPRLVFPPGWESTEESGETRRTVYRFPGATLQKLECRTADQVAAGMRGAILEYPVREPAAGHALLRALDAATLESDIAGFAEFDRTAGDTGLPLMILGSCPAHALMLEWFGYENFFYTLADDPAIVEALVRVLTDKFEKELWPSALASVAELIMHGNHFADAVTPPPLFRRFFLPYFQAFNARAQAAGKRVLWHADAAMGLLLELVIEAGFDGADCLATAPLVPETITDYIRVWQDRIVCWGGLPGIIFNPEYPEKEFYRHLNGLRDATRGNRRFIVGASDNVMPGALWNRIAAVRDALGNQPPLSHD